MLKQLIEDYRMDKGYTEQCLGERHSWLRYSWALLSGILAAQVCRIRGHRIIDDSYGGPDSGCMAGHCERCGYSFHTTLY